MPEMIRSVGSGETARPALRQAWAAQNVLYEDVGANRCRVTLSGEVCMAVPGLGALVERVIVRTVTAALQLLPCLVRPCCYTCDSCS